MVFAYVFVKGWIIDPYVQCFFDCSTEVLVFPSNYIEIVNSDLVTTDVTMVKYWGGAFWCSLNLSAKVLEDSTNVFLITVNPATLKPVDDPTLSEDWIFIPGGHQEAFDGFTSFEIHLYAMFVYRSFWGSHSHPYDRVPPCRALGFWLLLLLVFLPCVLFFLAFDLSLALFNAHSGYLQLVSDWCRCFSSWCKSSGLEQICWALWWRVPTIPYLDVKVWLLSHCRYRAVWVGFLYTVVSRLPSSLGVIKTSRNGMEPSDLASSFVNWMFWSSEFRCCRKLSICDDFMMVKVSSTNLLQNDGEI